MNEKKFIDTLYKKRSTFTDPDQAEMLANLLDTVSSDIYSESQRFIFELIQNADDAALTDSNEIHFDFHPYTLIVSHKGKYFDEPDIYAITNAGKGTKGSDATKTGYKGIGFKSVFGKSNRVTILSDVYSFRFDRNLISQSFDGIKMPWQIIPIWGDSIDFQDDININSLKDEFNVSTIIELDNSQSLKNELNELLSNGKILLFLRKITKITISSNGKLDYTIEKQINNFEESYNEVKLLKNDNDLSRWIVTTFDKILIDDETQKALKQDDKTPPKLKEAKFTEISFAAKIENGKIKGIKGEESLMFAYLPIKKNDFEFPFLVNGNFLTNASREGIHEDRVWNQWLFQQIGEKIFDWFELLSQSEFKFQILHLLPHKFNSNFNQLKISFDKSFGLYGKSKRFVPTKSSELKKAPEILIDKTGLSEQNFIPTTAIIEFINRETEKTYSVSSFVHPQLESKHKLNSLDAYTFDLENIEDFFNDDIFMKNHKIHENFSLISFLFEYVKNLRNTDEKTNWEEKLKTISFIKDEKDGLRTPNEIYFPSIQHSNEFSNEIHFIHSLVLIDVEKNKDVKEWLIKLGVDEQTEIAFIQKTIIDNPSFVNIDNTIDVTRYLYKAFKNGILKDSHFRRLKNLLLLTQRGTLVAAQGMYLSNFYKPDFQLENIHDFDMFISSTYPDVNDSVNLWKDLFINIGASEKLDWTVNTVNARETFDKEQFDYLYFNQKRGFSNAGHTNEILEYHTTKISHIENCISNYEFSLTFWQYVFTNNIELKREKDKCRAWYYGTCTLDIQPYFDFLIENFQLFPTTLKDCRKINEIFLYSQEIKKIGNKFLPILDYSNELPDEWSNYFIEKKIKVSLKLSDYLELLTLISKDIENLQENKERILLIYKKLSENYLSQGSALSEWGKENKLLSINGEFIEISKLKHVAAKGFISNDLIFNDIEDNSPELIRLFEIFGVTIIFEIIPEIKHQTPNATLKIQLQVALPFFTAILERKHFLDYSVEFKRLTTIIDNTEFYNASEIVLSFKNQDEIILGPSLHAYLANSELSFKGKWTSPITLYALVPELLKLFKLSGLSDELMLLIQLDENEIKQWLVEQGYELTYIQEKPEYATAIEKVKSYTTEEDIEQSFDLVDNSDEKSRISISQDAKENIFETLKRKGFNVPDTLDINYTIVKGIKNPSGLPIKIVVKSGKAGKIYFNPSEWLALTEDDTQLFVLTRGNIVRNITLNDLSAINDTFHMRFNTQAFAVNTNLKAFANFFRYLPYTHFIFETPESTTDYLQQFGLSERNPSSKELSSDDKNLLH